MPKLYYDHAGITIYHGDCRDILPLIPAGSVDLVLTDPPHGIGADRNLRANKQHGAAVAPSRDYGDGRWDAATPDADTMRLVVDSAPLSIIWDGNYFGLAPAAKWLVWDKDNGNNGYADCELAWSNLNGAIRRLRYRWMGMLQEHGGIHKEERVHPTQKPVPVIVWAINQAPQTVESILDPFMGSGTTLVAAKQLGRRAIGIEIEEKYCEIAAKRLSQEVLPFEPPAPEPEPVAFDFMADAGGSADADGRNSQ